MTASNVWVWQAEKPGKETFIRGSEITEVGVSTGRRYSYGKEIARSTVRVSYPGAEYGAVDLWTFDSQQAAARAAQTLLAALAADPCGLVTCCDGTVGVRPLPQVELE